MDRNKIQTFLSDQGANDVGFADITKFDLPKYPRAISICVKLLDSVVDEVEYAPTYAYYAHYKTVNALLDQLMLKTAMKIEEAGYAAYPIAASQSIGKRSDYKGIFSHKAAATLAGLGWIGKSGLLIHNTYGPRLRLGTILTDMPFECDTPIVSSKCVDCAICVEKCPASALYGINWCQSTERDKIYDPKACSEFMSNHFSDIGRGFVCGICMAVCPKGQRNNNDPYGSKEIK